MAYHCSFHRFKTGVSNIRKAPGFHLVSSVEDPVDTEDRREHKIVVASAGNRLSPGSRSIWVRINTESAGKN